MRSLFGALATLLMMLVIGCTWVDADECWPNTSGGFGGAGTIPIGAGVGATTSGDFISPPPYGPLDKGGNGGVPNPYVTPAMPANAYINCKARGLDAMACSMACGEVGAACSSIASHPYKSGEGAGQLTYCKNGSPSFTCTYTFVSSDACTGNFTIMGVFWYCAYAGGK